jgi:hypothetical protein
MVGTWVGRYRLSVLHGLPEERSLIPFTLDLKPSGLFRFTGVVQDDPIYGMAEPGKVTGFTFLRAIRFVKLMPVFRLIYQDRSVTLAEYIHAKYDTTIVTPSHLPIHYRGWMTDRGTKAHGTWRIYPHTLTYSGIPDIRFPGTFSTWDMNRLKK